MCERRCLIPAVVTDIHDSAVTYPSCTGCCSKLLVDPTTGRYHCIRCGTSFYRSKVQWRYRLVLSIADGTTLGRVVVFGRTLDSFFGKMATDFYRSLDDLEQTGYPATSMLSEALLRTFHGKYFYFGFKLTGSYSMKESLTLKHVLKAETSLCYSQLDCTSNIESMHTLAYQMLACSDAVYATVTDHMRLLVRYLRSQNDHKDIKSAGSNQSQTLSRVTDFSRSCEKSPCKSRGSLSFYKTASFGSEEESVRFSFETNASCSNSVQETDQRSLKRSLACLKTPLPNVSFKSRESFLAASDISLRDWSSFITLESFCNEESCFTTDETENKLDFPPQESHLMKMNLLRDHHISPTSVRSCGFHGNTFSHMSVTHRLDFENENTDEFSYTSKRVDNELRRRELLSVERDVCSEVAKGSFSIAVCDQALDKHEVVKESKHCLQSDVADNFTSIFKDNKSVAMVKTNCHFTNARRDKDTLHQADLQNNSVITELRMPESEGFDAFFESQFDYIEFSQEIGSAEKMLSDNISENPSNIGMKIGEEKCFGEGFEVKEFLKTENAVDIEGKRQERGHSDTNLTKYGNGETTIGCNNHDFHYLPNSEDLEDFLDSFEDCWLNEGKMVDKCQDVKLGHCNEKNSLRSADRSPLKKYLDVDAGCSYVKRSAQGERVGDSRIEIEEYREDLIMKKNFILVHERKRYKLDCKVQTDEDSAENVPTEDSVDLEGFLADISNTDSKNKEQKVEKTIHNNLQVENPGFMKEKIHVATDRESAVRNEERLFKPLSCEKYTFTELDAKHVFSSQSENELETITRAESKMCQPTDFQGIEENNSIIAKTPDLEQSNLKTGTDKSAFTFVPFYNKMNLGNKLCAADTGNKSEFSKSDKYLLRTSPEDNKQTVASASNVRNGIFNMFNTACSSGIMKTDEKLVIPNEDDCSQKEFCLGNSSADIFELSGTANEQNHERNSENILTICTPSFSSKLGPDISCLSEELFEESPLGASTPGLDECIFLDSQDTPSGVNIVIQENVIVSKDSKRKVKFDKRLRQVSSCHVMDIRMRINDSPLVPFPQKTPKSCLKLSKQPYSAKENKCSVFALKGKVEQKVTADVSEILNLKDDVECKMTSRNGVDAANKGEQELLTLDGSSDLFGESFIVSEKETCFLSSHDNENSRDTRVMKVQGKSETNTQYEKNVLSKSVVFDNNKDLWANESSDSLVIECASDEKQTKQNQDGDSVKAHIPVRDIDAMESDEHQCKIIREYPETPDLFFSQDSCNCSSSNRKSRVIIHSGSSGLPENQNEVEKTWKVNSSRKALKLLVTNTPDCDNDVFSYKKKLSLKHCNQSPDIALHRGSLQISHEMKENISAIDSPDIFGDSVEDVERKFVCDKKSVVKKSSVLCKKLLF